MLKPTALLMQYSIPSDTHADTVIPRLSKRPDLRVGHGIEKHHPKVGLQRTACKSSSLATVLTRRKEEPLFP